MNTDVAELKARALIQLDSALTSGGWIKEICRGCTSAFYGKTHSELCSKCCDTALGFDGQRAENFTYLNELRDKIASFFIDNGYKVENPLHILHSKGQDVKNLVESLFTIAGVQVFDRILFDEMPIDESQKKIFISQPSVRLTSDKRGSEYGVYSSFVNVCTESINSTPEELTDELSLWLKLLDSLVNLSEIRLVLTEAEPSWNGRQTPIVMIRIYYKGLEIGDVAYHYNFPQYSRDNIVLTDIGFGLERLCCCINKTARDYDIIGPYLDSLRGNTQLIDKIRVLVLLIGSNVLPSEHAQGLKVRGLIKELITTDSSFNWFELVPYFYAFWSDFTKLGLSPTKIRETIRTEIYRSTNRELAKYLRINLSNEEAAIPSYEFIENCLRGKYRKHIIAQKIDNAVSKTIGTKQKSSG